MFTEKAAQMRRERAIDKFITLSSVVDDGIVMSRNGSLIATIRVEGIPFETADDEFLDRRADQLNVLLRMIAADDTAIQVHRIRRFVRDRLSEPSAPGFARDFTLAYNNLVDQKPLMATELYVTLIERDLAPRSKARSVEVVEEALMERLKNFRNRVETLLQSLGKYGPRHLKETEVEGVRFSEQLSFYNFLLTGCWQSVRVPSSPLYQRSATFRSSSAATCSNCSRWKAASSRKASKSRTTRSKPSRAFWTICSTRSPPRDRSPRTIPSLKRRLSPSSPRLRDSRLCSCSKSSSFPRRTRGARKFCKCRPPWMASPTGSLSWANTRIRSWCSETRKPKREATRSVPSIRSPTAACCRLSPRTRSSAVT